MYISNSLIKRIIEKISQVNIQLLSEEQLTHEIVMAALEEAEIATLTGDEEAEQYYDDAQLAEEAYDNVSMASNENLELLGISEDALGMGQSGDHNSAAEEILRLIGQADQVSEPVIDASGNISDMTYDFGGLTSDAEALLDQTIALLEELFGDLDPMDIIAKEIFGSP